MTRGGPGRSPCRGHEAAARVAFLAFALSSAPAWADDEQSVAGQLFQAGLAAYAHRDYRAAARAFEEANVHAPNAAAMFNAALAFEAAGEDARAADAYSSALAGGKLRGADAEKAHRQLDALERTLGLVRIVGPVGAKASVAHVVNAAIPVAVHVRPGAYDVNVEGADGARSTQHVQVGAGASIDVAPRLPAAPATASPPQSAAASSPVAPPRQPDAPAIRGSAHTWGWVALGAAATGAIVAGIAGVEGLQARDAFESSGETSVHAHDQAATYRTVANFTWAVSGAAAIGGVLLLVLPGRAHAPTTTSEIFLTPSGGALRVRF